jgi:hypothetical protein
MQWSDIPYNPPRSTLRGFAAVCVVMGGAGFGWAWLGHVGGAWLSSGAAVAIAVGLMGLVRPPAVRLVFVGLAVISFPIGWLITRLLLAVNFYCVLTPLGLLLRLFGRDSVGGRFDSSHESYWTAKPAPAGIRSYFRQS